MTVSEGNKRFLASPETENQFLIADTFSINRIET